MDQSTSGAAKRILVVDDNEDAAAGVAMLLQVCGHDVHTVHRGGDVLQAALAHNDEVIFLDIGLPDMDGYEVASVLRAHPGGRQLRLIALSGFGGEQERQRALAAGFDRHLTKPADLAAIQAALAD